MVTMLVNIFSKHFYFPFRNTHKRMKMAKAGQSVLEKIKTKSHIETVSIYSHILHDLWVDEMATKFMLCWEFWALLLRAYSKINCGWTKANTKSMFCLTYNMQCRFCNRNRNITSIILQFKHFVIKIMIVCVLICNKCINELHVF